MSKTGIIILAAGSSSRLGQPKQLLQFKGESLLQHTIMQALNVPDAAVAVVTGAANEAVTEDISQFHVNVFYNPYWEQGMGSSIAAGLKNLLLIHPEITHCIITVCDQPQVTDTVFLALIAAQQNTGKGIVASWYSDTAGVPALFAQKYFEELLGLSGNEGAKKFFNKYTDDSTTVPFKDGATDIDTVDDYNELINE